MESVPEDTLEYVEDEGVQDNKDDAYNNAVEEEVDDNNAVEEEVYDADKEVRDGDDDTSATSPEKLGSGDRPGERYAEKKEEKKSFNFKEEMETVCKRLELSRTPT